MTNQRGLNRLAGATVIAAACWLYFFFHPRVPAVDPRPHEALGQRMAAEAVRLLDPGARLIVIARESKSFKVPACEVQVEAFLKEIKRAGKSVAMTQTLKLDPLRVVAVPSGDFFELLKNGRDNDVIVSFLGPPTLSDDQFAKLGGKRARVLAVCSGGMAGRIDLKKIFDQKLLAGAAVSRKDAPAHLSDASSQNPFDQMFEWITPANPGELEKWTARN